MEPPSPESPPTPPPGAVFELAERAVEFVQRALNQTLDYQPETLPILDHYLGQVPEDQPELVQLVAVAAGAYFGEVLRRALGGEWDDTDGREPSTWRLALAGGVELSPAGMATSAILGASSDGVDDEYQVPAGARAAVQEALEALGDVPEDEFYSLSGRLEVLMTVVDVARQASGRA